MVNPDWMVEAVEAAQRGDLASFARLVEATQEMALAVACQVFRRQDDARDAVQDAYVTAFQRLTELTNPRAFPGWLRRIVVARSLNLRRRGRTTWVPLDTVDDGPPVLDADEQCWTDEQRRALSRALLTLTREERRACELHYHAGWTAERLAIAEGVEAAAMRKRLQRIRDKLRKEIEMDEQKSLGERLLLGELPASIIELLAKPRLVDMPENPVSSALATLRSAFTSFDSIELPEEVDLDVAQNQLGGDAVYIDRDKLHRIGGERVLRYDLTLPLLLNFRWEGRGRRLTAAGKVYRRERESRTHLEAFNQLELLAIDDRGVLDIWWFAGRILDAVDRLLPGSEVRVTPTGYPMCARAWSLDIRREQDGAEAWTELMAWGQYADWVMRGIGADPEKQIAMGAGFGLERSALLAYGIDDVRKVAAARVRPALDVREQTAKASAR
jgi:RNA polymerase sigma factor (sigma-70 family)